MKAIIHGNLNMLFGFSDEMSWLGMKFKDEQLEEKYLEEEKNNIMKKSKIFSILVLSYFSFSLLMSIIVNRYLTTTGIVLISCLVFDISLSIINHMCFSKPRFILSFIYLRIFLFYVFITFILHLSLEKLNPINSLRSTYGIMLLINSLYFYLVDFNIIIQVIIPIVNSAILILFKFLGHYGEINVYVDIVCILIYYLLILLIKRQELYTKKISFFNSYKNSKYIDYTKDLINDLKNMVISLSKKKIIFANKFTDEYLSKNHQQFLNKKHESFISHNSLNELKLICGEEKFLNSKLDFRIHHLFKSMILKDSDSSDFSTGKNLFEISALFFEIYKNETNVFKRIGYFTIENNDLLDHFDVYIRKVRFKEDILEILIYDITEIKIAEKKGH
jgi:hypothetical protein